MKIKSLRLENFQGLKAATFDFEGQSASIYGDNATGKTTVYNAVTWLLFDRPSTGAKNYTPKTKGPEGDLHYLDHAAEARFIMDDGRLVTLRKVFRENYKKKKGSATAEFDGHSVDFFIDGVPVKEKEYTAALMAFCGGAEKMKMLTMPHYFAEDMAWDARRKILLEICGDVNDQDVIAAHKELEGLDSFLLMPGTVGQHYTVEEYKKIAAAQKSDINKQLQDIPGRIDEAQRAIPEERIDPADVEHRLGELHTQRDRLTEHKSATLAGNTAAAAAKAKTAGAAATLAQARTVYLNRAAEANQSTNDTIGSLQLEIFSLQSDRARAQEEADRLRRNMERMTSRRDELLKEYSAVQVETWNEAEAVCPTCHRELPEEDVARMREDFNLRKSNRLQTINEQGQKEASKEKIEEARQRIAELQTEADTAEAELERLGKSLEAARAALKTAPPFEETEEYARLAAVVAACQAEEEDAGKDTSQAVEAINRQIEDVYEEARRLQEQKGQEDRARAQEKRIEELKAQEKRLSAQYEELEKGIYLCDQFTKAKVDMLTDRINNKFQSVRFRLFVEQQNGGVKDDCEVMIPAEGGRMVPYAFANNAARINAGLEIIEALSKHWGLAMPVFIDNAESVTHLARLDAQIIRLVVSEGDRKLRLELEAERKEAGAA